MILRGRGGAEADKAPSGAMPDRGGTHFIEPEGYRVLSSWKNEVLGNTEGALLAVVPLLYAFTRLEPSVEVSGA